MLHMQPEYHVRRHISHLPFSHAPLSGPAQSRMIAAIHAARRLREKAQAACGAPQPLSRARARGTARVDRAQPSAHALARPVVALHMLRPGQRLRRTQSFGCLAEGSARLDKELAHTWVFQWNHFINLNFFEGPGAT